MATETTPFPPGETKVVLSVVGPGAVTHLWFTFLWSKPHPWAKAGSANHQEMLFSLSSTTIARVRRLKFRLATSLRIPLGSGPR